MTNLTTFNSNLPIQSTTSKGAIEFGLENQIRHVCKHPKFEPQMIETINTIWTHYCGANPEYLTPEFEKEAIDLILKKFSMLGTNEIKEAFRLASSNVINADMRAFSGRINIQVIGNVLSAYQNYRNPILFDILKKKQEQDRLKELEDNRIKEQQYKESVISWFKSKPKVESYKDVRFYQYEVLENEGIIKLEQETIIEYLRKAKSIIQQEKEEVKTNSYGLQDYRKIMNMFESSEKARIKNLAKELALFDAIKNIS